MFAANLQAASDADLFSHALMMLEGELALDIPPVPECILDSMLAKDGLHSSTDLSASTVPSSPCVRRGPLKAKRYRDRKREELTSLRSMVKTLEVRLASLKERHLKDESLLSPFPRIWELLAMQEAESRQAAERENEDLRETIELHMRLALKLDQVIKKVIAHVNTKGNE